MSLMTALGMKLKLCFQDVRVRRPILAVSDSTKAGNLLLFDDEESVIINRDSKEGRAIRQLIKKMASTRKVAMECEQGVYHIPTWVIPPADADVPIKRPATPFGRPGSKP